MPARDIDAFAEPVYVPPGGPADERGWVPVYLDTLVAALTDEQRRGIARLCLAGIDAESERRDNSFWTDTASAEEWLNAMVGGIQ